LDYLLIVLACHSTGSAKVEGDEEEDDVDYLENEFYFGDHDK
jgi:hypothetical protein